MTETNRPSKQKLHAYGAEIYADWDVYGGKHPRMYKADKVDVEIARLHEELRQARIDLAQMAAEALRTIGKVATTSETADGWKELHRAVATWSAHESRFQTLGPDYAALNKILAAHNPFDSSPEEPEETRNCIHGRIRVECLDCTPSKASEPQPDTIPQRYWENK